MPFDQNWHHLYSSCAGGKHFSNDSQIRLTGQNYGAQDMHKNAQKVE